MSGRDYGVPNVTDRIWDQAGRARAKSENTPLLPTGSEEKGVLEVGTIPVEILPSCHYIKTVAL